MLFSGFLILDYITLLSGMLRLLYSSSRGGIVPLPNVQRSIPGFTSLLLTCLKLGFAVFEGTLTIT